MSEDILAPEMAMKLHEAIHMSEGFCRHDYMNSDGMHTDCVIGCLARIEGVSLDRIREWDKGTNQLDVGGEETAPNKPDVNQLIKDGRAPELERYPLQLLRHLQEIWDGYRMNWSNLKNYRERDEEDMPKVAHIHAREQMHALVRTHAGEDDGSEKAA